MDDHQFDKRIKDKAEHYQDTGADEAGALAGLHAKLAGFTYVPWYVRYQKTIGYTAAVLCISLLNFGVFSYLQNQHDETLQSTQHALKDQQMAYDSLKLAFETLKETKTDTVYIVNTIEIPAANGQAIASTDGEQSIYFSTIYRPTTPFLSGNGYHSLGIRQLSEVRTEPLKVKMASQKEKVKKKSSQRVPAKVLRAIEKHNMQGIGFQYGPTLRGFQLLTDEVAGDPGWAAGMMAEFILSPAWSIETGIQYANSSYELDDAPLLGENVAGYPGIDDALGELEQIEQTTHALIVPVHLKYHHPISKNRYLFASAGISPHYYALQRFEYEYEDELNATEAESSIKTDKGSWYPGTYDLNLGFEQKLNNKSLLQFSVFYNHAIQPMGVEGRTLRMIGLNSAFKFRVK
ncbi:outer membrane beta-barrel protein [Catalinimonas niigatensis]|uniref:outer membrane beta-barrel protein n=1 Tax=Catalinimonas niigatensis TaxID=1397264 RepID=UPI0026662206|nr:outer membrane beta-barrel protein [Catalinimonas niigatensis]WPP51377.1 outer membrane beta-barrel protein [Catalinimonas niigatensis]